MAATVADVVIAMLKASGVHRVYGIPGDSLNGFTDALRRAGGISWQHVRPVAARNSSSWPRPTFGRSRRNESGLVGSYHEAGL